MPQILNRKVGATGYGLMGLTWRPKQTEKDQAFSTMREALSSGANLWNGGEFYGPPERNSLHLLADYFQEYPNDAAKVVLSVKGGADLKTLEPTGDPVGVRRSIDQCLAILEGRKRLDMFGTARVDPTIPVEHTMQVIKEYIDAGKIGAAFMSECSADSIRRAAKVTPIAAVEVEFSIFCPEILHNGVAQTCAELDIPIAAYSPLGNGILTGQIKSLADMPEGDHRHIMPRFAQDNFQQNLALVKILGTIAAKKGCSAAQLALAWIRFQSGRGGNPVIIPIPGATTVDRVRENAEEIILSDGEFDEINIRVKAADVRGGRTFEGWAPLLFGDSPPENRLHK